MFKNNFQSVITIVIVVTRKYRLFSVIKPIKLKLKSQDLTLQVKPGSDIDIKI